MPILDPSAEARRRVHPSRASSGEPRLLTPDPQRLASSCRTVIGGVGASPRLYAEKHVPAAAPLMAEVEARLYPAQGDPGPFDDPRLAAALYRMFRASVPATHFAADWVHAHGLDFALEAIARIDDFEIVLGWIYRSGSPFRAQIDAEWRLPGVPFASRNLFAGPTCGAHHYPLARALRPYLAAAPEESHAAARATASRLLAGSADPWLLPACAYLFPNDAALADRAAAWLLDQRPDHRTDQAQRRHWGRWLLATAVEAGLAARLMDEIVEGNFDCVEVRDDSPLFTLVAMRGPAAEAMLLPRLEAALAGRGTALVRALGRALAGLRGGRVAEVMAAGIAHRALGPIAAEYFQRHAHLAPALLVPRLASGHDQGAASDVLTQIARAEPALFAASMEALASPDRDRLAGVLARVGLAPAPPAAAAEPAGEGAALLAFLDQRPWRKRGARAPAMPKLWTPASLPRPVLVSGGPLADGAMAALGELLALAEPPREGVSLVRAACTAASLDAFAWELLRAWDMARGPDSARWAARAPGLLGSEALIDRVADQIHAWSRAKTAGRASAAVAALWVSPSPRALTHLVRVADRGAHREVRAAAVALLEQRAAGEGTDVDALRDRAVPDLGLGAGRVLELGKRKVHVSLGEALDLALTDEKGKRLRGALRPLAGEDPERVAAAAAEVASLRKELASAIEDGARRLELAMIERRAFSPSVFRDRLAAHPILARLAARLAWGPPPSEPPRLPVPRDGDPDLRVLHPVEIDEATAARALAALAAAGLTQPFPQIDREIYRAGSVDLASIRGRKIPYRRVQALVERGGYREHHTGCHAPLHDASWLARPVAGGRLVARLGFNPGPFPGDTFVGTLSVCDERAAASKLDEVPAVELSELLRDMLFLAGPG